jgi:hypothetical protein
VIHLSSLREVMGCQAECRQTKDTEDSLTGPCLCCPVGYSCHLGSRRATDELGNDVLEQWLVTRNMKVNRIVITKRSMSQHGPCAAYRKRLKPKAWHGYGKLGEGLEAQLRCPWGGPGSCSHLQDCESCHLSRRPRVMS